MLKTLGRIAALGCAAGWLTAACGTTTPGVAAAVGTAPSAAAAATSAGTARAALLAEVDDELARMRTSHYQHHTDVDEARGRFDYDCSGLLDHVLGITDPAALHALPVTTSTRPLAADIEHRLDAAPTGDGEGPWQKIPTVAQLQPGDIVAWLATENSTTADTGHVMIVTEPPQPNPDRPEEWLVPVADSTISPHAHDSRRDSATGLGTGVIGLAVDAAGDPTGFFWRGGESSHPTPTGIALGRPT